MAFVAGFIIGCGITALLCSIKQALDLRVEFEDLMQDLKDNKRL